MQRLLTPIFATLLISGCSTISSADFEHLKQEVAQAQYSADQAMRYAMSAEMKATEALEFVQSQQGDGALVTTPSTGAATSNVSSNDAKAIAQQALKIATEAKTAAARASDRAERMYKKSVGK